MKGPCETVIDYDTSTSNLALIKCGKPGRLYKEFILPFGIFLCDQCYTDLKLRNVETASE